MTAEVIARDGCAGDLATLQHFCGSYVGSWGISDVAASFGKVQFWRNLPVRQPKKRTQDGHSQVRSASRNSATLQQSGMLDLMANHVGLKSFHDVT